MAKILHGHFAPDRGGRRRIKDRRFLITVNRANERRTGLRRRSGLDRRYRLIPLNQEIDRRES